MNFVILWLYAKVFSAKFGAWCSLAQQKHAIRKSFLRKNHIFHQFVKVFSLESLPLYGITIYISHLVLLYKRWGLTVIFSLPEGY